VLKLHFTIKVFTSMLLDIIKTKAATLVGIGENVL
jgi:hypothetical protein